MEEIGHIPGQLWSGSGSTASVTNAQWLTSGVVGGIPPHLAKLVYFAIAIQTVNTAGFLTLMLPSTVQHGGTTYPSSAGNINISPVKSWYLINSQQGGPNRGDLAIYDFSPSIPIEFDTDGPDTFVLLNGDFQGNNRSSIQFGFLITVLPGH